jgi:hypothetical protein
MHPAIEQHLATARARLARAAAWHVLPRAAMAGAALGAAVWFAGVGGLWVVPACAGIVAMAVGVWSYQRGVAYAATPAVRRALLKRLDDAAGAGDAIVTADGFATGGADTDTTTSANTFAAIVTRIANAAGESAVRSGAAFRALPARETSGIWKAAAVIAASLALALLLPRAMPETPNPASPGAQSRAARADGAPEDNAAAKSAQPTRTTTPGGDSAATNADSSASGTTANSNPSNPADLPEPSAPDSSTNPAAPNPSDPANARNNPRPGPRTAEPNGLLPQRASPGEQGPVPATTQPGTTPASANQPKNAPKPWEQQQQPDSDRPRPDQPDQKPSADKPLGERRRPPMRLNPPPNPKPEADTPHTDVPLKIQPEISNGDRKTIPVTREVYEAGDPSSRESRGTAAIPAGVPSPVAKPDAPVVPGTALSESERAWQLKWLGLFGGRR